MQPTFVDPLLERRPVTMSVLTVAAASFALLQSLVIPVLSEIQQEFDCSQTTVTWVLTAYLLSASVSTPLMGRAADAVGKVPVLVLALAALSAGSLAAAVAPSIGWLITARVVQGLGGGVLPVAFSIIRDQFGDRTPFAVGVVASVAAAGFGAGIVVAGPIVDTFGLSGLFWLPMAATATAASAAALLMRDPAPPTGSRLPLLPALLLTAWLVALLLALTQGNNWGWASAGVVALLMASCLGSAAWVGVELRAVEPLIDLRMMRARGVWTSNIVAGAMGFTSFACLGFLPQLLQTPREAGYGFGATISESGHLLLPAAVANFLIGFTAAPLVKRLGSRVVVSTGLVIISLAMFSIVMFHEAAWQILLATSLQGTGQGLAYASLIGVVVHSVPSHQTGTASGMNANIRTIGGSIGSSAMAGILAAHATASGLPSERGYQTGFVVLGAVALTAAAIAMWMPDADYRAAGTSLTNAADGELGLVPGAPPASVA